MLCKFLLSIKVDIYIYIPFFGFPSHLGHNIAPSRIPCAI